MTVEVEVEVEKPERSGLLFDIFSVGLDRMRRSFITIFLLSTLAISAGTDTTKINIALKNCLAKALADPEAVIRETEPWLIQSIDAEYNYGTAYAYGVIGRCFDQLGQFDTAIYIIQLGLPYAEKIHDKKLQGTLHGFIGDAWYFRGDRNKALESYFRSYEIRESAGDMYGASSSCIGIGNVYSDLGRYQDAINWYQKTLDIQKEFGNKRFIYSALHNMGAAYEGLKDVNKAEEHYLSSLEIKKELRDTLAMCYSYSTLGKLASSLGQYAKAEKFLLLCKEYREKLGDIYGLGSINSVLGDLYMRQDNYARALTHFYASLEIAKETGAGQLISSNYLNIHTCWSDLKQFDSATKYAELYIQIHDSLTNVERAKDLSELQTRFETVKKEKENQLLKQEQVVKDSEIRSGQLMLGGTIILAVLILGFGIYAYNAFRQKRKANILLELQKEEINSQKHIIEEKNKDITDSINYAQRIQCALLTSESYFEKNIKEFFILYKPKDIVSGDFYWSLKQGDDLFIAVADCTGHGVPGAFMSMIGINLLNEIIVQRKVSNPALVLDIMREEIIHRLNPDENSEKRMDGMDMVLAKVNAKKLTIDYAGANNSFYKMRDGILESHDPDKMPVGMHTGFHDSFTKRTLEIREGDMLYFLTDGYPDQFGGPKGKKFKYRQLEEKVLSVHKHSMEEQRNTLDETFEAWRGKLEQVDDVTIIGIRIQGTGKRE